MNNIPILASAPHQAVRREMAIVQAEAWRRLHGLVALRTMIATWRERRRFRRDLQQLLEDNPHLIGDIGLTGWQARTEIVKPFWQA